MPNVLVREIDEGDLELLKRRAEASGRSLQGELKRVLELAARASDEDAARAWLNGSALPWPDGRTPITLRWSVRTATGEGRHRGVPGHTQAVASRDDDHRDRGGDRGGQAPLCHRHLGRGQVVYP